MDLSLTNLDSNLTVKLTSLNGTPNNNDWGNSGIWNIRGVNINLDNAFWSENNSNLKEFVFASGNGTEVTADPASQTQTQVSPLTLNQLTGEDKINSSTLSGELKINPNNGGGRHVTNVGINNGSFTFIG